MNVKRSLAMLLTLAMLTSVFAAGPAAAQDCAVGQQNSQANVGNVNLDTNVNAGNVALSLPVLSPGSDSDAEANQIIQDQQDAFQSQSNYAEC